MIAREFNLSNFLRQNGLENLPMEVEAGLSKEDAIKQLYQSGARVGHAFMTFLHLYSSSTQEFTSLWEKEREVQQ